MLAIINDCETGKLDAEAAVVISNNASAGALDYARASNLPAFHLSSRTHADPEQLDLEITKALQAHDVDWVVLAGYMKKVGPQLLAAYQGRIFNIHPSLLPAHGGRGMYGIHVHESVIASGDTETGVTIHMVEGEYDQGRILAQVTVPVEKNDTPAVLAARVLKVEHQLYSATLQDIIEGKIGL